MIYLNLFLIAVIVVCIVDMTDFPDTIKRAISFIFTKGKLTKTNFRFHLVDCSLCLTWWTGLAYLICTHHLSILNIAVVILLSVSTMTIHSIMRLTLDIINICIKKIYEKID